MAKLFTQEQEQFIRQHSDGARDKELCELVNNQFGLNIKPKQMKNWRGNHNARSKTSLYGWKKGKKAGIDFKPQSDFKNSAPIGTETIFKDVVMIKVARSTWVPKHRYLYEQAYGPVSQEDVVIFIDGNNRNFDLDNLALITRRQLAILNKKKMLIDDKELNLAAISYAKLIAKVSEVERCLDKT